MIRLLPSGRHSYRWALGLGGAALPVLLAFSPALAQLKPPLLKIGVVNSELLYQAYPEFRKIEEQLAREAEGMQAGRQTWIVQMEKMQGVVAEKENQLKVGANSFTDKRKAQLQAEIDSLKADLQERYNEQVSSEQEKFQKRKAELLSGVLETVNKQIDALGEAEAFDFIIDSSNGTVVYAKDPEDLTDRLLRRLEGVK